MSYNLIHDRYLWAAIGKAEAMFNEVQQCPSDQQIIDAVSGDVKDRVTELLSNLRKRQKRHVRK